MFCFGDRFRNSFRNRFCFRNGSRNSFRNRFCVGDGFRKLGRPGQPSKRWGGETPLTPHVFPAARGRPDTQHPKLLFLVWPPLFVPSPCAGICGSLAPGGGQLKTGNFGFSGSGRPWATGATVKKVGGGDETPLTNCVMREPPPKLTISPYKWFHYDAPFQTLL